MKRTSTALGESLENIGYGLIGAALLASSALAFLGSPLAPAAVVQSAKVVGVRLEGLVVTPQRTYSAGEWARRPAAARRVSGKGGEARPRRCDLPRPSNPATQTC